MRPLSPAEEKRLKSKNKSLNQSSHVRPNELSTVIDPEKDRDKIMKQLDQEVDKYLNTEHGEENQEYMNDSYPAHVQSKMVPEIVQAPI